MQTASALGITEPKTPSQLYGMLGRGLHAIWIDGSGTNMDFPTDYGTLLSCFFNGNDAAQLYIASSGSVFKMRTSSSGTGTWRDWKTITLA